ncbi:amidohydrolase [candidate division KSB1 bacterium]|nr:amidohydrolase [candidate division KSB1 bacterium]
MTTRIAALTQQILPEIIRIRRHLHQHPELSWQEKETTALIRDWLADHKIEFRSAENMYATLALIPGKQTSPIVGLRADIDALPIQEATEVPHRSQNAGVMHACGHDGHTATLLGATWVLAQLREELPGTAACVFQPAEENGGGGRELLASGFLNDLDIKAFFALHTWPYIPLGTIGVRYGGMMSAIDDFKIIVHGKSGHAAHPLTAVDPVWISAQIINAVQGLVTRERHGADPCVITVATIHGGIADNVIPAQVEMAGTIRTIQAETRTRMVRRFIELVQSVAQTFGATAEVAIEHGYPPLLNTGHLVELIAQTGTELLGADKVIELHEPSMGGEDFAYYLQKYSGAMFRLGVGPRPSLHSDKFDFDDNALAIGINMMATVAMKFLQSSS